MIHGYISVIVLLCAIYSHIKDRNGKLNDSGYYRGIGIGSLILKIVDWIVLIINEKELVSDPNQFGFQEGASTSMCSWTAIEVVNVFKNSGSSVFGFCMPSGL